MTVIDHKELSRRHYAERPLHKLTEDELAIITELGKRSSVFAEKIAGQLDNLCELAHRELDQREFEASS